MTPLLPALFAASLAFAGGDLPRHEQGGGKKVVGPPLRMGAFATLRSGVTSAGGVELSYGIARKERLGLDLGATITTPHRLADFQPARTFNSYALVADGVYALTPTFNAGPSVSLAYRSFRQDWSQAQGMVVPTVGVKATAGLLTQRTWQLQLTVRGALDLVQTRLAFDTAQVQSLNPWDLQVGGRLLFGRQRSALVASEVR